MGGLRPRGLGECALGRQLSRDPLNFLERDVVGAQVGSFSSLGFLPHEFPPSLSVQTTQPSLNTAYVRPIDFEPPKYEPHKTTCLLK